MTQCNRILDDGRRCSNPAVPGTDYCREHSRIQFRRIPPAPAAPVPPPAWRGQPRPASAAPAFPGLREDSRRVLVGPQGLIWLAAHAANPDDRTSLDDRLVRLLAALSQHVPLPGQVTLRRLPDDGGAALALAPANPAAADLSQLYDLVADAAAFSGGLLYIGEGRAFIQYRDGAAPLGYDADNVQLPPGDELFLVDTLGTHPLAWRSMAEVPLLDSLLAMQPEAARIGELPTVVYVLAASALYHLLARYFSAHHLRYRVARLRDPHNRALMLFEITARQPGLDAAAVPAFVLAYLEALPRVSVLTVAHADAGRHLLVQWRMRHPCRPSHIAEFFPADSLVIFANDLDFGNYLASPAPAFFDGDELIAAHGLPAQAQLLAPTPDTAPMTLAVPLRLVPAGGPLPAADALVLDAREVTWLRRIVYRLPAETFASCFLCLGEELSVLVGEGRPLSALPLGRPLRRVHDSQLFLPMHARLEPSLPWPLLAGTLDLQDGIYTLLLDATWRLDVPRHAFQPLSRALLSGVARPATQFAVRPPAQLPDIVWTPPAEDAAQAAPAFPSRSDPNRASGQGAAPSKRPSALGRILGRKPPEEPYSPPHMPAGSGASPPPAKPAAPPPAPQPASIEQLLRSQAEAFTQGGDHLSAALCLALLADTRQAAHYYRQAARALAEDREGSAS